MLRTPHRAHLRRHTTLPRMIGLAAAAIIVATVHPAGLTGASTVHQSTPVPAPGTGDGTLTIRTVSDVDGDGSYDAALDTGIPGARAVVTDAAGHTATATTGPDGTVTPDLTGLSGGKYRVQLSPPPGGALLPAPAGGKPPALSAPTSFVDVSGGKAAQVTTGLWDPSQYCQANAKLLTCGLARGNATGQKGLVTFDGSFGPAHPGGTAATTATLTHNEEQQAVFGIGTDRTGNAYLGTYVKRHTEYGPAGAVNAIYRYNRTSDKVTTFTTLPGTLTAHTKGTAPFYLADDAVYGKVGREGIGDVDVSGDGTLLYAVNLNDNKLYAVPINGTGDAVTAGTAGSYRIPKPATGCAGEWHPFGLGVRGSRVLVGGVCGAENTVSKAEPWGDPSRMRGFVYTFTGSGFTPLFDFGLDYPRGCAYRFTGAPATAYRCDDTTTAGQRMSADWEAWNERVPRTESHLFVSAPQPMLSDIEIADNGDLILGLRDRFADMQGNMTQAYHSTELVSAVAAGDVLRACSSGSPRSPGSSDSADSFRSSRRSFSLEKNDSCGALKGALPDNEQGPGGGEFHNDRTTHEDAVHDQITEGGLALQPGRNRLWSTAYDPFDDSPFEQGVRLWNPDNGSITGNRALQSTHDSGSVLFGKGNGLADLELVCDQAPVQIGNRVWYDTDRDGIQDPGEPPVSGVKVTATPRGGGTAIAVTTDANGEYYIGTNNGLKPGTSYDLAFDHTAATTAGLPGSPTATGLRWTLRSAGSDRRVDSDADSAGKATVTVGKAGTVDHTIGAGLITPLNTLGDRLWYDTNGNGVQDDGEFGAAGADVGLFDPATGKELGKTTTGADGKYLFTDLSDGSYKLCFLPPNGYSFAGRDTGRSGDGSTAAFPNGCTEPVTLGPDHRTDLTLDAGLVKTASRLTLVHKDAKKSTLLPGAVFQLWQDTNGTPGLQTSGDHPDTRRASACATDQLGRCSFHDLPKGTYYLKQMAVPEGYAKPKNPVTGPYRLTDGKELLVALASKRDR